MTKKVCGHYRRSYEFRSWCLKVWSEAGHKEFAEACQVLLRRRWSKVPGAIIKDLDICHKFYCTDKQTWALRLKAASLHMGVRELPSRIEVPEVEFPVYVPRKSSMDWLKKFFTGMNS